MGLSDILSNPQLIGMAMAGLSRDREAPMNAMRSIGMVEDINRRREEEARKEAQRTATVQALKGFGQLMNQDQQVDLSMFDAHPELKGFITNQMQQDQAKRGALSQLLQSAGPDTDPNVITSIINHSATKGDDSKAFMLEILKNKLKPKTYDKTEFLGENQSPLAFDPQGGTYTQGGQPYSGPVTKFKADPKEMNPQLVGHTMSWKDPQNGMIFPKGLPVNYKDNRQYVMVNGKEFDYRGPTDPRITNPVIPPLYLNIPGFQTPEGGPAILNARGGGMQSNLQKVPTESDITHERNYIAADAILNTLENKFKETEKSLPSGPVERVTGYPSRQAKKFLQTDSKLASLDSLGEATLSKLIRTLGEVGTLTDKDIERARNAKPTTNDTPDVRKEKFEQLRGLVGEIYERGKRYPTTKPAMGQQTFPPSVTQVPQPEKPKTFEELKKKKGW